jgi:hypothetical protein
MIFTAQDAALCEPWIIFFAQDGACQRVVAEHGDTCGRLSVVASEGGQARTTKEVVVLCQLELDGRGGGRGATEEEE